MFAGAIQMMLDAEVMDDGDGATKQESK
jgi:hypothetical protein